MYASAFYFLFKCITKHHLYKQIEPLHSIDVSKLTPGYGTNWALHGLISSIISMIIITYETHCAIWYHLHNLKNVKTLMEE